MKKFNPLYLSILAAAVILVAGGWWLSTTWLEWEKPVVTLSGNPDAIGLHKVIDIQVADMKTGISHVEASIYQDNQKRPILAQACSGEKEKTIRAEFNASDLKLRDGEAVLEIKVIDRSLLKNTQIVSIKAQVDLLPPQITLLSAAHNINPGGTCLAIYKLSKEVAKTGVQVESESFASYPATIGGKPCYVSYFPIPTEVQNSTKMMVFAEDKGGNKALSSIPFYIRKNKPFRSDSVNLGDNFLEQKTPEFQQHEPKLRGKTPVETFAYVNETMRKENFELLQGLCRKSEPKQLWDGIFLRMKNGAPMAMFGDKRTYLYQKQPLGNSTHMGVDLASTQNAPIEAANGGIVVYTGYLGIYGQTVVIDHGLGIISHYSHMNGIKVKDGQKVAKGEIIGNTGVSGLAGGDHLHYGMMVGCKFVNPIEWWDPHWIKDNVDKKMNITVP